MQLAAHRKVQEAASLQPDPCWGRWSQEVTWWLHQSHYRIWSQRNRETGSWRNLGKNRRSHYRRSEVQSPSKYPWESAHKPCRKKELSHTAPWGRGRPSPPLRSLQHQTEKAELRAYYHHLPNTWVVTLPKKSSAPGWHRCAGGWGAAVILLGNEDFNLFSKFHDNSPSLNLFHPYPSVTRS